MLLLNIVDSVIAKASQQEEIVSPYLIQRKTLPPSLPTITNVMRLDLETLFMEHERCPIFS